MALTSARPVLHDVRSAEDRSGIVGVAGIRVDRDLVERGGRLSVDGRKDEGTDEDSCG